MNRNKRDLFILTRIVPYILASSCASLAEKQKMIDELLKPKKAKKGKK